MVIIDVNGFYELKVDKARRVVYETIKGQWSGDDFERLSQEYKKKIMPFLGKGEWAKICDMREYKPSTAVSPEVQAELMKWSIENGFRKAGVIVASATLKMQLNRSVKDEKATGEFENVYFDNFDEADEWLKSRGF